MKKLIKYTLVLLNIILFLCPNLNFEPFGRINFLYLELCHKSEVILMVMPIVFLHKRGKEEELGIDYLIFKDQEEYCKTSEETLAAIIKDLGYNVIQILTAGENHNYVQS